MKLVLPLPQPYQIGRIEQLGPPEEREPLQFSTPVSEKGKLLGQLALLSVGDLEKARKYILVDQVRRRVLVAIPMYAHLDPLFLDGLFRLHLDFHYVTTTTNLFIADARNDLAQEALDKGYEFILYLDSDVILPPNGVAQLMSRNVDIVTGLYVQKGGEHLPNIYNFNSFNEKTDWYDYNNIIQWEDNTLVDIDGCGGGCLLVKTDVFRKLKKPWFKIDQNGEDLYFCRKAKEAGFKVYCDTGVKCGHLGVDVKRVDHFYAGKLVAVNKEEEEKQIAEVRDQISDIARLKREQREVDNAVSLAGS